MVYLTHRIDKPAAARRRPAARFIIGAVLLAGIEAIVVARWLTGTGYAPAPLGLPDPGVITSVGLPITQFLHDLAGVAVVGLLFLRCAVLTQAAGPAQRHLGLMASRWGWCWVAGTAGWIVLTISELTGLPIFELPAHTDVVVIVLGTDRVLAEAATLWVALAVALFGARLSGRAATAAALLLTAAALLPSALTGHAGSHNSPTLAMISLGVHLVAAALWVGGLLALVVHLRTYPDQLQRALPRFSAVALGCVVLVGLSGLIEAVVVLDGWAALWGSTRGHLIVAKVVALGVLVVIGYWHRRRTMPRAACGNLRPLLGLVAGELVLMGATVGLAVVLSTTA